MNSSHFYNHKKQKKNCITKLNMLFTHRLSKQEYSLTEINNQLKCYNSFFSFYISSSKITASSAFLSGFKLPLHQLSYSLHTLPHAALHAYRTLPQSLQLHFRQSLHQKELPYFLPVLVWIYQIQQQPEYR